MTIRTTAQNPLLHEARLFADRSDPWGYALGYGFAAATVLAYIGEPVNPSVGYRASVAGPSDDLTDSPECVLAAEVFGLATVQQADPDHDPVATLIDPADVPADTWTIAAECAAQASRVFHLIATLAEQTGQDY